MYMNTCIFIYVYMNTYIYIYIYNWKNARSLAIGVSDSISVFLIYNLIFILDGIPLLTPPLGTPGDPDTPSRTTRAVPGAPLDPF